MSSVENGLNGPASEKKVREDSLGTHLGGRENGLERSRQSLGKET